MTSFRGDSRLSTGVRGTGPAGRALRGYTLIEVLVGSAVTVVGFLALTHLQTSVLKANENAWNMTGAVRLATHVQETSRSEALRWYNDTYNGAGGVAQNDFLYLRWVGPPNLNGTSGWRSAGFYPDGTPFALVNQVGIQPAWDAGVLRHVPGNRNARYCVEYRLTWLVPDFLIRSEVRVLWPRPGARAGLYDSCPADMVNHPEDVFSITIPATVMKNVFVSP